MSKTKKNPKGLSGTSMHTETYGMGEPEPVSPLVPIIEKMFSNELHGDQWKLYTREEMVDLLKEKMRESNIPFTDRHYLILKRKLDRCTKVQSCLQILSDNMLGGEVE